MAQKYSGWFLEKLFPVWLFMFFYRGFYSGNGELNSKNHMKDAEWFPPWAKHTFTVGKEKPVRACSQCRASRPWPVLQLLPTERCSWLLSSTGMFSSPGGCHQSLEKSWGWEERLDLHGLPAVSLTRVRALQTKLVKGSDCSPVGSTAEPGFSSLVRVNTEMSEFPVKQKNGRNAFRKLRSELVRSISVTSNCLRLTHLFAVPLSSCP